MVWYIAIFTLIMFSIPVISLHIVDAYNRV